MVYINFIFSVNYNLKNFNELIDEFKFYIKILDGFILKEFRIVIFYFVW